MIALLARLAVGAAFVVLGLAKLADPVEFLKLVRLYGLLPEQPPWALNGVAALLPWVEITCGLALIAGRLRRGAALLALGLLAVFTFAVVVRGRELAAAGDLAFCAVSFDCGCGTGVVNVCRKLAENVLLMVAALLVLAGRPRCPGTPPA